MKKLAFFLAVATLLGAGCDRQESSAKAASESASASMPADPQPAPLSLPAGEEGAGQDVIADVLNRLSQRVIVRYDRQGKNNEGKMERQVFLEVVDGSVSDAEALVSDQFVANGYLVGHRFEDRNGARQLFRKRGGVPVRSLSRAKGVGPALKDARAVGSIYIKQ